MVEQVVQVEVAPVQSVAVASTPEIKPQAPTAKGGYDPAEVVEKVGLAIREHLSDEQDLATFEVRQGITFRKNPHTGDALLEFFLRDKVFVLPVKAAAGAIERGTLDIFARTMIERLRDPYHYTPPAYSRYELLSELLYEMRDFLPGGIPEVHNLPDESSAKLRRQIDLIKDEVTKKMRVKTVTAGARRAS